MKKQVVEKQCYWNKNTNILFKFDGLIDHNQLMTC